jgi:hypothetical protein
MTPKRSWIAPALAFIALGGLLFGVALAVFDTYRNLGVEISVFGWFVMGAASVITLLLALLLMGLSYYSAKNGFDDGPPRDAPPE